MTDLAESLGYLEGYPWNKFKQAGGNIPENLTLGDITYHETVVDENGDEIIQLTLKERFRNILQI
ncbi:MAG: hypothetical protein GY696_35280 [Gammaproteobacteria bacterium]|nr:hypothetical protein [Gammaproteobacteria bacterium]